MELSHSREFQFPVPTHLRLESHLRESGNFALDRAIFGGSPTRGVTQTISEPHTQPSPPQENAVNGKRAAPAPSPAAPAETG